MATSFSYSITLVSVRRAMTTGSPLMSIIVLNSVVSLVGLPFNIIAAYLMWTAFVAGMVSSVLPLSRMTPLWVILLSLLFLGKIERVAPKTAVSACLVVAGGMMITLFR